MEWLSGAVIVAGGVILWTLFRGAPYVPTRRKEIESALDAAKLTPGDLLVDLGSGDGIVLKVAAEKGLRAVGYEINPLLVLISRWRLRKYEYCAQVRLSDFRYAELPGDTRVIFVFSAEVFLASLQGYLNKEVKRLGHPVTLISHGFKLPGEKTADQNGASFLYRLQP
jgi:hypothetical protein